MGELAFLQHRPLTRTNIVHWYMVPILAACSLPLTAHGLFYLSICPYEPALTCCGIAGVVERGEFPLATGPNQFAQGPPVLFLEVFSFSLLSLFRGTHQKNQE